MTLHGLAVLYVPALDRRRLSPDVTPFLSQTLSSRPVIELATHPSVELVPTILTGVWPPEHQVWQVRIPPPRPERLPRRWWDRLPARWLTTLQCVRHRFDSTYDLPTVEPRRRRLFEIHRIKFQRYRADGGIPPHYHGRPTVLGVAGSEGRYRTLRTFQAVRAGLAPLLDGSVRLDIVEFYALDLFSHWNLDRPQAMASVLRRTDELLADAVAAARRRGIVPILLVDHGQELVRRTIDLRPVIGAAWPCRGEFCWFSEVTNARFWFFTDRARRAVEPVLRELDGAEVLDEAGLARHHVAFDPTDGFGDLYLFAKPGAVFFPHDFYHPLVNTYMSFSSIEHRPRLWNPVHRGAHGYLPGAPSERGWLMPLDDRLTATADAGELIDVAPTLLSLAGFAVPATMRGHPLMRWEG